MFLRSYEEHVDVESMVPDQKRADVQVLTIGTSSPSSTPRRIRRREKPPSESEAAMMIQRAWRRHIVSDRIIIEIC